MKARRGQNSPAPEQPSVVADIAKLRVTNDRFRLGDRSLGEWSFSEGVLGLGHRFLKSSRRAILCFNNFEDEKNIWSEHEQGWISLDGTVIAFDIQYYDRSMIGYSPDKFDPSVTWRVMKVRLRNER